jgi:PAS domain-containing protein
MQEAKHSEGAPSREAAEFMLVLDVNLHVKAATPSFYRAFRLSPEAVRNRPLHRLNHVISDNPQLQQALYKAQQTSATIAPFTVELRMDGEARRTFDCSLERITLDGGAKLMTLSMRAPSAERRSAQTTS